MNKTWMILRYELKATLQRRSFVVVTFGVPLIAVLIFLGITTLGERTVGSGATNSPSDVPELEVEGFVDYSGIVKEIPADIREDGVLFEYPDEASARSALEDGAITAFYIIPEDFVETGELIYIDPDLKPIDPEGQSWVMRRILTYHLLGADEELIEVFWMPLEIEWTPLSEEAQRSDQDSAAPYAVSYAVMMVFYILILMSSSLFLNSMNNERKNRVMEVLMVSIDPLQLFTGKIIALGITGLIQAVTWLGTVYAVLSLFGRGFNLPPGFELPTSILAWGIVFFILGYAVFGSLMGVIGALAASPKEASQSTFIVIVPFVIPMMFNAVLIRQPFGLASTILSIFPLTAPIAMIARLPSADIPLWQPVLSAALLFLTAFFFVRGAARLIRVQNLLTGKRFTIKNFIQALLERS
jgi:ABC-2 type transport system permease protein